MMCSLVVTAASER